MRRFFWFPLLALVSASAAGCWQPRYFAPREHQNGIGPDGDLAAVYRLEPQDRPVTKAEVRIWSGGAKALFTSDDVEVVDLHVGFEVENNGEAPIELDLSSLTCEDLVLAGVQQDPLLPEQVDGSGYAAPGATTRFDVVFRPPTATPRDIDGFAVRFVVRDDAGNTITQSTPFAPARRGHARDYPAYWGPYGGLYWGHYWGHGFGFAYHW